MFIRVLAIMKNFQQMKKTTFTYIIVVLIVIIIASLSVVLLLRSIKGVEKENLETMMPVFVILVGVLPAVSVTIVTELIKQFNNLKLDREKRKTRLIEKREKIYANLLIELEGLYTPEDYCKKVRFFRNYRLAILYSPDNVLEKINRFLDLLVNSEIPQEKIIEARDEMQVEMRRDLIELKPIENTSIDVSGISNVGPGNPTTDDNCDD